MIKSAAITGAARGLGKSYASLLAAQGAKLLLIDIEADELNELARELSLEHDVEVKTIVADLSKPEEQAVVADRLSEIEQLDLLINLAGFVAPVQFHVLNIDQHMDMLNVHVASVIRFCRAVLPNMLKRKRGGEYPRLCVWGLAHAIETDHLLNRSG